MRWTFPLLTLLTVLSGAFTYSATIPPSLAEAEGFLLKENFAKALESYQATLPPIPKNAQSLYNMALAAHKLNQPNLAVAALRKNLSHFSHKKSLNLLLFVEKQHFSTSQRMRNPWLTFLVQAPPFGLLWLLFALLLGYFLKAIKNKTSYALKKQLTTPPLIVTYGAAIFIVIIALGQWKFSTQNPKTVLASTPLKAAPETLHITLGSLDSGTEVLLLKDTPTWAFVSTPQGKGWVKKDLLF